MPLNTPTSAPAASVRRILSRIPAAPPDSSSDMIAVDMLTTAPTDRSMPASSMVSTWPSATMPSPTACSMMLPRLIPVRKRGEDTAPTTATASRIA